MSKSVAAGASVWASLSDHDVCEISRRFWAYVERSESGCWPWTGPLTGMGYGELLYGRRSLLAHRISYVLLIGPVLDEHFVCHHCDNPPCVRPDHLFLGNQLTNMRDCAIKGKMRKKLTPEEARRVRELYDRRLELRLTLTDIGKPFCLGKGSVMKIGRRQTWAWLDSDQMWPSARRKRA